MDHSAKEPIAIKKNLPIQPTMAEQRISVKDIGAYCMVDAGTVRRWLKQGKLKAIKLPSNQSRVSVTDFKDFLTRYNMPIKEEFFRRLDS